MPKYFPCFLTWKFILAFTKTPSAKTEKKVNKKTQDTTHKTQLLVAERDIYLTHFTLKTTLCSSGTAQSGFQSGLETAPLAAVCAGYCHFFGQFQAKSRT